jgi:Ion channel
MLTVPRVRQQLREYDPSYSYGLVLTTIVATVLFIVAAPDAGWSRLVETLLQGATLVAACLTARVGRRVFVLCLAVIAIAVFGSLASLLAAGGHDNDLKLLNLFVVAVAPLVLVRGMGTSLRRRGVDRHTVAGVLSLYLLVGMLCALIYAAVGDLGSGPLFQGGRGNGTAADRLYFSFITQTTVGYGDYSPAAGVAKAVAVFQALLGQFYLVTIVGIVVGRLGQDRGRPDVS